MQSCNGHAIRVDVNNPSKQAERRECLQRERPVQGKNHAGKKALVDPTFTISKTLQRRNSIPNSDERVKATQG